MNYKSNKKNRIPSRDLGILFPYEKIAKTKPKTTKGQKNKWLRKITLTNVVRHRTHTKVNGG